MSNVQYDKISENPDNFKSVFQRQISLADDIRTNKVDVDQGSAEAKALFGATKTLEIDLHARVFAARAQRISINSDQKQSEQDG